MLHWNLEFADELGPILILVSSWQKLEFECWPSLLNEVQSQFETNAGKVNIAIMLFSANHPLFRKCNNTVIVQVLKYSGN